MATTVTFKIESLIPATMDKLNRAAKIKVHNGAALVHKALLGKVLTGERTGIEYRVPYTGQYYRASKEGEAPATRLGTLRTSFKMSAGRERNSIYSALGSELDYAYYLENPEGTVHMASRPHLSVAGEMEADTVRQLLQGDWSDAIK